MLLRRRAARGAPLAPPSIVKQTGKAMVTTSGYIHPDDPPGTWRSSRPHGKYIRPCSSWQPSGPITDAFGKSTEGPTTIFMSWTLNSPAGLDTVSAKDLESTYGPPHPATRSVVIGWAAPLGRHWTWSLEEEGEPGPRFIAEALPDGSARFHFAKIGRRSGGGGNSAGFMAECLVEKFGTPSWLP